MTESPLPTTHRVRRIGLLVVTNALVFVFLFGTLEVAYRIHVDGLGPTLRSLSTAGQATAADLPDNHWVVRDEALGYRLNPSRDDVNSLSIRGDELAVPKPDGVFRIPSGAWRPSWLGTMSSTWISSDLSCRRSRRGETCIVTTST